MSLNHPQDLGALANDVELTIYTLPICPWCYRAKALMRDAGIRYVEKPGPKTRSNVVPEIFDGDHLIGGIKELQKFIEDFQS
jgi:glutaredoxin